MVSALATAWQPVLAQQTAAESVQITPMTVTNPIAATALKYVGQRGGECWPWMRAIVLEATGKTIGFDYREGFFEAGAVEVSEAEARQGDIIQFAIEGRTAWDADYPGLHTAIVLESHGNGVFTVIDSNSQFDGMVRIRTDFSPRVRAAERGVPYRIYRVDAGDVPGTPRPGTGSSLATGDAAIVAAGPEGLRLRSAPGGTVLHVMPDGTRVTVTGAGRSVSGRLWVPISTPWGEGWAAAEYLVEVEVGAATAINPGLTYRNVIALVASD